MHAEKRSVCLRQPEATFKASIKTSIHLHLGNSILNVRTRIMSSAVPFSPGGSDRHVFKEGPK